MVVQFALFYFAAWCRANFCVRARDSAQAFYTFFEVFDYVIDLFVRRETAQAQADTRVRQLMVGTDCQHNRVRFKVFARTGRTPFRQPGRASEMWFGL